MMSLWEVSQELSRRLTGLFLKGKDGTRPVFGANDLFQLDPNFSNYIPFAEYFHGDTGMGLGACHQTGWTALLAELIAAHQESTLKRKPEVTPEITVVD